jgi:hypothetical protein
LCHLFRHPAGSASALLYGICFGKRPADLARHSWQDSNNKQTMFALGRAKFEK